MPSSKPYISQASVADALDALIYPSKPAAPNPLERLLLVELSTLDAALPHGELTREYALHHLLLRLITDEYTSACDALHVSPPAPGERQAAAAARITDAALRRNPYLLMWTLLYYRYVRVDLNFTPETVRPLVSFSDRSVRRYYQYALRLLTRRLTEAEWKARREHTRQRLAAALPIRAGERLVGRDQQLDALLERLSENRQGVLHVTGTRGIGKTAFVTTLLQRLIEWEKVDRIVWIDSPLTTSYVLHGIEQDVLEPDSPLTLKDYLLRERLVVVLDDADVLLEQAEFAEFLHVLRGATVIPVTSSFMLRSETIAHVVLPPLDEDAAYQLIHDTLSAHMSDMTFEDVALWLWEHIGGNPDALKTAIALLSYHEPEDVRVMVHEQTMGRVFDSLPEHAQVCWCALALLPAAGATLPELIAVWPHHMDAPVMGLLMRHYIVERVDGRYRLSASAREMMQHRMLSQSPLLAMTLQLMDALNDRVSISVDIVEQLLLHKSPFIPEPLTWIARYWRSGLKHAHFAQWLHILTAYPIPADSEMQVAYAICLRRLGKRLDAERVLHHVTQVSGRQGNFALQSAALLENAVLARLQGAYDRAVYLLDQCDLSNVDRDPVIAESVLLERSQIALDQGEGGRAVLLLKQLTHSLPKLVLMSEAYLLSQDYAACRELAEQGLDIGSRDPRMEISLYTLIGRSYALEHHWELARTTFELVVTIGEASFDTNAAARARSNLAAVLLELGRLHEAQRLLEQAVPVLEELADRVGHAVALHNQRLTTIYFTR